MTFTEGAKDGNHYWLTPEDLMEQIKAEFEVNYDPCPYPKPDDYDGLKAEWGSSSYVNPPFGVVLDENGKKRGATAWARKCIEEYRKGKRVVMVYPIDKWVLMLLDAGAKVRNLKDVKWEAIEDRTAHKGTGRHIAMFILDPADRSSTQANEYKQLVNRPASDMTILEAHIRYSSLKSNGTREQAAEVLAEVKRQLLKLHQADVTGLLRERVGNILNLLETKP